jgi:hypothetical protein
MSLNPLNHAALEASKRPTGNLNCSDCQIENLIQPCEACVCNPRKEAPIECTELCNTRTM